LNVTVHNPDQHMQALRTIIAQGRKRIGLLIGAGGPAGMADADGNYPLIPAVEGLTTQVLTAMQPKYEAQITALKAELKKHDIETILSRIRSFAGVLGASKVHDMDGAAFKDFGDEVCKHIGEIVNVRLPKGKRTAYHDIASWITGVARDHPVEIFTTNYDQLFEEAFESNQSPYFDGFAGGREPFFDPVSVSSNDLPARWTRLWKLHGSLGWAANEKGEVVRTGQSTATHLVFPEHLKYDQTQKAPYAALFDRLRAFLELPDTLLITSGFSFADSHISARIGEALASNPSASVFAFQFKKLEEEAAALEIACRRSNFTVYARDKAVVNGVAGDWQLPAELPAKNWGPIRQSYWDGSSGGEFTLGRIEHLARFVASSRSLQSYEMVDPVTLLEPEPAA
jgi:SIR2-like domain